MIEGLRAELKKQLEIGFPDLENVTKRGTFAADHLAYVSLTATADLSSIQLFDGTSSWAQILPG
jgi:hypothetical protein